jgi:hypothetical protein
MYILLDYRRANLISAPPPFALKRSIRAHYFTNTSLAAHPTPQLPQQKQPMLDRLVVRLPNLPTMRHHLVEYQLQRAN